MYANTAVMMIALKLCGNYVPACFLFSFSQTLFECGIFTPKEKKLQLLSGLTLYPSPGPANGGGTRVQLSKCIWSFSVSFGM